MPDDVPIPRDGIINLLKTHEQQFIDLLPHLEPGGTKFQQLAKLFGQQEREVRKISIHASISVFPMSITP